MRPLETRTFGDAAHVALLFAEQVLEVDSFEGLARLAQRQLEKPRRNFRRDRRSRRQRSLAEQTAHVLCGNLAFDREREIGHDVVQMVEISGPVRGRKRRHRGRLQSTDRSLTRRNVAPQPVDERGKILAPLSQRRKHDRSDRKTCEQPGIESPFRGEITQLLTAGTNQHGVVLFDLGQQKGEPFLLCLGIAADLRAVKRAIARFLEKRQPTLWRVVGLLGRDVPRWDSDPRTGPRDIMGMTLVASLLTKVLTAAALVEERAGHHAQAGDLLEATWSLSRSFSEQHDQLSQLIAVALGRFQAGALRKMSEPPVQWLDRMSAVEPWRGMLDAIEADHKPRIPNDAGPDETRKAYDRAWSAVIDPLRQLSPCEAV